VNSQPQSFAFGGGTAQATVSSGNGCTWAAQSNASWITITSGNSGSGNGVTSFSVAPNTGLARTGTLTVASTTITVTQARDPATCRYTLDRSAASFAYTGGTGSIAVATDSDCSWSATASGSWISITSSTSGTGNGSLAFSVAANNGLARSGAITVGTSSVGVTQARDPSTCRYTLNPNGVSQNYVGGTTSLSVSTDSDCSWSASASPSWITIASGDSGSGSGAVTIRVAANNGGLARVGSVTVGSTTIGVAQSRDPSTCRFSLDSRGTSIGSGGGTGSIRVFTDSDCSWSAISTGPWLGITSGGSGGMGAGSISWSAGSNTGPPRSAEIIVMGLSYTVDQAGS
jgi:hypothetical protein